MVFGAAGSVGAGVAKELSAQGAEVFLAGHTKSNVDQVAKRRMGLAVSLVRDAVLELAQELYKAGLSDFLSVLEAEKELYGSENELAQSEAAVSVNLVALYKALGGGW